MVAVCDSSREMSSAFACGDRVKQLSIVWQTVILTIAIEAVTCLLRFGFSLESTRDTANTVGRLTFGLRIHHGYIGVLLLPIAFAIERRWPRLSKLTLVLSLALIASDLIHHFIVLWPVTGSPQFDLFYR